LFRDWLEGGVDVVHKEVQVLSHGGVLGVVCSRLKEICKRTTSSIVLSAVYRRV